MTTTHLPPPPPSTACSDRAALLRTVLEYPDDDAPRLVYADWLDDEGHHPAANFIRRQFDGVPASVPLSVLMYFDDEIIGCQPHECLRSGGLEHSDAIMGAQSQLPNGERLFRFRRGLLDEIHMPCAAFMEHAAALFAAHPITCVRLVDKKPRRFSPSPNTVGYRWLATPQFHAFWPEGRGGVPQAEEVPPNIRPAGYLPSESAAFDALSAACVAHGRSLAGLRPLGTSG